MHRRFGDALAHQVIADLPRTREAAASLDVLMAAHRHELAAVLIEPLVQGAGGMLTHAPEVLAEGRPPRPCSWTAADRRRGVSRASGGRGTMFACEQAGVTPDLICLSKALTGGTMGLAATVATREVFDAFWSDDPGFALMHGPDFHGQPAGLRGGGREPRPFRARAATGRRPALSRFASTTDSAGYADARA